MSDAHDRIEASIRNACAAGDFEAAATHALDAFGPEILNFLTARLRSRSDADEAFSLFAEDVWRGLAGFGFRCSARTWMYALARNAANRYASAPQRRPQRNLPLSGRTSLAALVERVRSATQVYARTAVKTKMRELRERLSIEDQTLLMLHVDRALPWRELAVVMHDRGAELEEAELTREAARLRKRFERVKAELRELAIAEGILKA